MAAGFGLCRLACLLGLILAIQGGEAAKCQTKDGLTVFQVLQQTPNVTVFTSLIQQANMISAFNNKNAQLTIFVPLDYAFGALLPLGKGFFDLFPGVDIPRVLVNYHLSLPALPSRKLDDDVELTAGLKNAEGELMKLTINSQADPLKPFVVEGETNVANITRELGKEPGFVACNSVVYLVDAVLLPSEKMVASEKPKVTISTVQKTARSFEPLVTPRPPDEEEEVLVLPGGVVVTDEEEEEEEEDPLLADDPILAGDADADADAEEEEEEEAPAKSVKKSGRRSAGK